MEATVWKENFIRNKLNIYTSIQCVVSRGFTLGKLGILQSSDWTQCGIHSPFLLNRSQNNNFGSTASLPRLSQSVVVASTGQRAALTKLISTTTVLLFKKLHAGPEKQKKTKKGLQDSAPTQQFFFVFFLFFQVLQGLRSISGAATFPPPAVWVDYM